MPYTPPEQIKLPDPVPVLRVSDLIDADDLGIDTDDPTVEERYLASVLMDVSYTDAVLMDFSAGALCLAEAVRQKYDVAIANEGEKESDSEFGVGEIESAPVFWVENETDGSRVVELRHPLHNGDDVLTHVTLHRFRLGDEPGRKYTGVRRRAKVISNLTRLPADVVSQMYIGDFTACNAVVVDFLSRLE